MFVVLLVAVTVLVAVLGISEDANMEKTLMDVEETLSEKIG